MAQSHVWLLCIFLKTALHTTLGNVIVDSDPPVVTCSNVTLLSALPNSFLGLDRDDTYTYSDANPDPSGISYNVSVGPKGDLFPPGYTPIEMFASDILGNKATCVFYVHNTLTELPVNCPDLNRNVTIDPGKTTYNFNPDFGPDNVIKSINGYKYHGDLSVDISIDGSTVGSSVPAGRHEVVVIISDDVLSKTCTGFIKVQGVDVSCSATEMKIIIPSSILEPGDDLNSLHLNNDTCFGSLNTEENIVISIPYAACGTTVESSGDSIIYSNAVIYSREGPAQSLHIPVQCALGKNELVDGSRYEVMTDKTSSIKGYASFALKMKRYRDDTFTALASPEKIWLKQELYYAVYLYHASSDDLSMFIDSCWATTDPEPSATPRYDLIENGCSRDSTLIIFRNLGPLMQGFSFKAFTFANCDNEIYIHCSVTMCVSSNPHNRCQQGCIQSRPERSIRSVPGFMVGPVSSDHIVFHKMEGATSY